MRRGKAAHDDHGRSGRRRADPSGLFEARPRSVVVLPVLFEGQIKAVIELASIGPSRDLHRRSWNS